MNSPGSRPPAALVDGGASDTAAPPPPPPLGQDSDRGSGLACRSASTWSPGQDGDATGTTSGTPARKSGRGAHAGGSHANQALELVRKQPGVTIPELTAAMKIQPNYVYRVLPKLAADGWVKREGKGWRPGS